MLRVTQAALAAWREHLHGTYPARLVAFLRQNLPEHDSEDLPERSAEASWRAGVWDLVDEQSVTTYVVLATIHGPRFDEQPWARELLADPRLAPPERIRRVYEVAVRRATVAGTPLAAKERHDP